MQPRDAVGEIRQRFGSLLVSPPRDVPLSEPLVDLISSMEFAELLEWVDEAIGRVTGQPFYTPPDDVLSFETLGDVCAYIESACRAQSMTT